METEDYINYLVFEGNYLNGKRFWKGKVHNNIHTLIFEGEYLNGVRIWIRKE